MGGMDDTARGDAAAPAPLRVLVVDDHALTCAGVELLLSRNPRFFVAATLDRGRDVIKTVTRERIDIVLLDLELPDMNGADLLAELTGRLDMPVVVLSGSTRPQHYDAARRLGALGLVSKADSAEHIVTALGAAGRGQPSLSPGVKRGLSHHGTPAVALSPRQLAMLHFLRSGSSNKEIAYRLGIAAPTVSFHLAELRRKLGAPDNRTILDRARALELL